MTFLFYNLKQNLKPTGSFGVFTILLFSLFLLDSTALLATESLELDRSNDGSEEMIETIREMPVEKVTLDEDEPVKSALSFQRLEPNEQSVEGEYENIDRQVLLDLGIRKLSPGMSVFRFLKIQVKAWGTP